jgi:hypothetical protein
MNWFYGMALVAIAAFCFWKPDFPKRLAPKIGIRGEGGLSLFLVVYWVTIPVIIHRLMSQIRLE